MIWYKDLYTSDNVKRNIDKYRWKLEHNAGMIQMYVICLSHKEDESLEIISSKEFMKSKFDKEHAIILGMARGYDRALELVELMVADVYHETAACQVREYFMKKVTEGQE